MATPPTSTTAAFERTCFIANDEYDVGLTQRSSCTISSYIKEHHRTFTIPNRALAMLTIIQTELCPNRDTRERHADVRYFAHSLRGRRTSTVRAWYSCTTDSCMRQRCTSLQHLIASRKNDGRMFSEIHQYWNGILRSASQNTKIMTTWLSNKCFRLLVVSIPTYRHPTKSHVIRSSTRHVHAQRERTPHGRKLQSMRWLSEFLQPRVLMLDIPSLNAQVLRSSRVTCRIELITALV